MKSGYNISHKLDFFIVLKLTGGLNPEREKQLDDWRAADPKNEEEYQKKLTDWGQEKSKDIKTLPEDIEFYRFDNESLNPRP